MIKDLLSLREEEIFKTLKELKNCNFVVIGGYAVNAYALPRFSVDCDIVVKEEDELGKIQEILKNAGYQKEAPNDGLHYSGDFVRFEKKIENNFSVSIDILIHKVTDRMTGAVFDA